MTPEDAESIVQEYGGAVASLKAGDAVLPNSVLSYSKTRIRYAFYMYIEELIKIGALGQNHADALVQTYALLNTRFQENAGKINKLHKQYAISEKAREELARYGGLTVGLPSIEDMQELADYIEECKRVDFS
jgi:hypothetical protein